MQQTKKQKGREIYTRQLFKKLTKKKKSAFYHLHYHRMTLAQFCFN